MYGVSGLYWQNVPLLYYPTIGITWLERLANTVLYCTVGHWLSTHRVQLHLLSVFYADVVSVQYRGYVHNKSIQCI